MKKLLYSLLFLAGLILVLDGCSKQDMTYISKHYEIYGTWVNPEYADGVIKQKRVIYPDGLVKNYRFITDDVFDGTATFVITNKWIESDGTVWYTLIFENSEYCLAKISNEGQTLEWSVSRSDYPKVIDKDDPTVTPIYQFYNRKYKDGKIFYIQ